MRQPVDAPFDAHMSAGCFYMPVETLPAAARFQRRQAGIGEGVKYRKNSHWTENLDKTLAGFGMSWILVVRLPFGPVRGSSKRKMENWGLD